MTTQSPSPSGKERRAQPETFRASGLAASFSVNDIQKSLAWYCDVLGFIVGQKHERDGKLRAVSLKAGAVRIVIGLDDGARGANRAKGQGCSLQLTTSQDIDAYAALIVKRGGVLETPPAEMYGARSFSLRDLDGFKFVISSERKAT